MFQELLRHLFSYDTQSGNLIRKSGRKRDKGRVVGCQSGNRYRQASLLGKKYNVHRLVWAYHHGEIPPGMVVDHIDRDTTNNRIENLRVVTQTENLRNRSMYSWNTSGYPGVEPVGKADVSYRRKPLNYYAVIWHRNRRIRLGKYSSFEEAKAARIAREVKYGYRDDPRVLPPDFQTNVVPFQKRA